MAPTWNLKETKALIAKVFGEEQLTQAARSLDSAIDRLHFATYHYLQAKQAIAEFNSLSVAERGREMLRLTFEDVDHDKNPFFVFDANIVACLQSIHAIGDILAFGVYKSLKLKGMKLTCNGKEKEYADRDINLNNTLKTLNGDYDNICGELEKVSSITAKTLLADVANKSKHQCIPKSVRWISFLNDGGLSIKFDDIPEKHQKYRDSEVLEILEQSIDAIGSALVETGVALHTTLVELSKRNAPR